MYIDDQDFGNIYQVFSNFSKAYHVEYVDYLIQIGLLFKRHKLCIPKCSMRNNIIKEKHVGSLGGHFRINKTLEQVSRYYHWPRLQIDVKKFVEK